jgi:hypothetical protein
VSGLSRPSSSTPRYTPPRPRWRPSRVHAFSELVMPEDIPFDSRRTKCDGRCYGR